MTLSRAAAAAALVCSLAAAAGAQDAPRLTIDRLYDDPSLSGESPRSLKFSPDGTLVTFLKGKTDDSNVLDLWAYDAATGAERMLVDSRVLVPDEGELSEEEKARRERMRVSAEGIISYQWDESGAAVLVPLGGDVFYVTVGDDPEARRITETEAFETDPRISPSGRYVSFVRDQDVFAYDLQNGAEIELTTGGEGLISNGVAEFVMQEEYNRFTGYWWSKDDRYLAYTRIDESPVDVIERFDISADDVNVVPQRYPRAGRPNATTRLFVRDLESGSDVEIDLGDDTDVYIPRVQWLGDTHRLIVQRLNRDQTVLDVLAADLETGATAPLFTETAEAWINITGDAKAIDGGDRFLWLSERDGFRHIYLYAADGTLVRQVTSGDWVVKAFEGVDEAAGRVFFTANKDTVLETHLYAAAYESDGAEAERITAAGGSWGVTMPDGASGFIGSYSDPTQPRQVALYDAAGERVRWIEENAVDEDHPYFPYLARHKTPQFGTVDAEDGTALHYSILKPDHCTAESPCPALHLVYGGPHAQTVDRGFTGTTDQFYAQQGFVVFRIDNRGSYNRGHAFEAHLHKAMGQVEVRDQLVGLEHLKSLDYVDGGRVGVFGWSYGGYMTLMLLGQAPGDFAAGIAGAPVSDWSLYDTGYTERYMETPESNPDGYENGSVFPYLENIAQSKLMLIQGMADDNVTFDNSTRVMAKLQEANIPFEVMVYPGQRHGIRGTPRRKHLMTTMMSFWERALAPTPEP